MILSPETCPCTIQEVGPSMANSCGTQFFLFMSLLEGFINGRCDLADPCNRVKDYGTPDDSYDFVVVGSGAAGSVVAARLAENPQWKVLLLESGGDEPTASSVPAWVTAYWFRNDTDWMYFTEPQDNACMDDENNKCYWNRAKMLGGCTVTNGMMYMRGHAADYDGWVAGGAKGWGWKDVFPQFLKTEDNKQIGTLVSAQYHSKGGKIPVQQFRHVPNFAHDLVSASIELGYPPTTDLNGDVFTGFAIAQTMNDGGSRYSTARAYLRPMTKNKNLHVLLNAHGSRVILDSLNKKVVAVEYIKDGQTKTVKVNKEAIISAGALNSPQILLLSGIGPKQTLDKFNIPTVKDLPGVGQNLHNHVGVNLAFTLTKEQDIPVLNWKTAMEYMLRREGPLSSTGMSQVTAILNSKLAPENGTHPDIQLFFRGYDTSCGTEKKEQYGDVTNKRSVGISVVCTQPKSRGYVTLRSVDPLQAPVMQPNYFLEEHDLDVLVDAARISFRLANTTILREKYGMIRTPGHGEKECGIPDEVPSPEYIKCLARHFTAPENHQVGTCKMGPESDPMAVVDMELKVHGIEGLRVADASIMPTVVTANTAAPTMMIGERAAGFIIIRYQRYKTQGFDNKFGEGDTSGNYASNEGNDKWGFGGYGSNEAKDDKLTEDHPNNQSPWDDRWQHWGKSWPMNQWQNKPPYQDWQAKNAPIHQRYFSSR